MTATTQRGSPREQQVPMAGSRGSTKEEWSESHRILQTVQSFLSRYDMLDSQRMGGGAQFTVGL